MKQLANTFAQAIAIGKIGARQHADALTCTVKALVVGFVTAGNLGK
ncbi:hypothetical protein [Candidatus Burkholderia verschuerenii]|nr:hypothetical protein [Candidatus Burkholderia verschuerenii]